MFSGIIEQRGRILEVKNLSKFNHVKIGFEKKIKDLESGESVAVNGVCLTVTRFSENYFVAQIIGETLRATNLGLLEKGMLVNLERALRFNGKVSGHFVTGHVDGIGKITQIRQLKNDCYLEIECPKSLMSFFAVKGSVAVDGISLTIQTVRMSSIVVSIIPHTLKITNLSKKTIHDVVNLEIDLLARYKDAQLTKIKSAKGLSLSVQKLKKMGF